MTSQHDIKTIKHTATLVCITEFIKCITYVHNIRHIFSRYGWLFTSITCLILGYLLVWQRGLHSDDYSLYDSFISMPFLDILRGYGFPIRALSYTTSIIFAGLLPTHEFFIRLLSTVIVGINALLLGSLVYKVLGSRLAGVVSGWLFLMPFYAQEATLWASAGAYIVAANLLLISLHAFLHAITHQRIISHWGAIGVIGFVLILFTGEQFALPMGFLPILVGITTSQYIGTAVRQAMYILILLAIIASIVYFSVYYNSGLIRVRGGIIINYVTIMQRTQEFFYSLWAMFLDANRGQLLIKETFDLGLNTIFQSCLGSFIFSIAIIMLFVTVFNYVVDNREYSKEYGSGLIMIGIASLWFIMTLLFPAVLIKNQGLAPRMLYLPFAGVSIGMGTLAWLTAKRLQYLIWYPRLVIAGVGAILILSTITMAGYAQVFATRFSLNQQQIAALIRALPSKYVPQGSYIVPYNRLIDERMFYQYAAINEFLWGVFEASWSGPATLNMAYQRKDIQAIAINRWTKMHFTYACDQQPAPTFLNIQGIDVPIDKVIIFGYQSDTVRIIDKLTMEESGQTACVISFPIAAKLKQYGSPTIEIFYSN